ncbi:hypothetical protein BAU15_02865 [Enterococcus sp. JM4C]|uniref:MFS transporter n=1 Tax=Candidatus Enterococcus huntleyi TaxID=1857217 RepID=UPI00137A8284|nr:MFS transporter [Enterococcus sp. JM4C]KAF1299602.1 hypothetical protein BAU15_02865 [Enterococcus sp. JM4C]
MGIIKNKEFMILFLGRLLANFSDSLYAVATTLLVYHMTHSTLYSGIALFLTSSTAIIQILLNPLLDRINIKKFLVLSQLLQALLLLLIPSLYYTGRLTVTSILIIMPVITLINQLVYPSQISLLPKLVKKAELLQANSLFTLAYQGSDTFFNAISGVLISIVGIYSLYYISSTTFLINSLLFLLLSKTVVNTQQASSKEKFSIHRYKMDSKEIIDVLKGETIAPVLLGFVLINLVVTAIYANLPAFALSDLQYSLFLSASGLGILSGIFLVNMRFIKKLNFSKLYPIACVLMTVSWSASCYSNFVGNPSLAVFLFFIGFIPIGVINVSAQMVLQTVSPKEIVGKVVGYAVGLATCLSPLGAIIGGLSSIYLDAVQSIATFSVCILFVGVYWAKQDALKQLLSLQKITEIESEQIE